MLPDRLAGNRQYCLDKAAECDSKAAQARDPNAAKEFQSLAARWRVAAATRDILLPHPLPEFAFADDCRRAEAPGDRRSISFVWSADTAGQVRPFRADQSQKNARHADDPRPLDDAS